jgi:hypothetical protein
MTRIALLSLALSLAVAGCSKDKDKPAEPPKPAAEPATGPGPGAARTAPHAMNPHAMDPGAAPHGAAVTNAPGPTAAKDDQGRYVVGALKLKVPDTWTSQSVTSSMRKAQFELPAAKGDDKAPELVVYQFGNRGAGSVEANIDRWVGQFQQADGSASKDKAKTATTEVAGMKVTTVDVSGHYVAAMQPGAAEKHDSPGYRMLAAIVEADDGAYYFKLVGPEASVAAEAKAFTAAIESIETTFAP